MTQAAGSWGWGSQTAQAECARAACSRSANPAHRSAARAEPRIQLLERLGGVGLTRALDISLGVRRARNVPAGPFGLRDAGPRVPDAIRVARGVLSSLRRDRRGVRCARGDAKRCYGEARNGEQ